MHQSFYTRIGWGWLLLLSIAMVAGLPRQSASVAQAAAPAQSGIVCTTDASPNPTFTLTAKTGYIGTPDGNTIFMWSYALGAGDFQHPGPVLCVNQGDTVTVILHNTLPQRTSIVFPGQEHVQANGVLAQPEFTGSGTMTSLTNTAAASNGSMTYSFVATQPGTYLYESGTEQAKQVQMGLFGALIVRPAGHPDWVYNRADTQFNQGTEFMVLLSEIDPLLHQAVERNLSYNMNNYRARYWLINGRGFPDTIAPNNATWLPGQPYGALAHIHPYNPSTNPTPAVVRYLNVGTEDFPFHPHGNHSRVIGRDGQPWEGPNSENLAQEKFSIPVGPGQTWDATFSWYDAENWDAVGHPIPVEVPRDQNLTFGPYYGSPYLGTLDAKPVGTEGQNQCGEYYHIAHNHNLAEIAGWGVTMIGQVTYTRIDPPLPNSCP